jgi:hypothetical protein
MTDESGADQGASRDQAASQPQTVHVEPLDVTHEAGLAADSGVTAPTVSQGPAPSAADAAASESSAAAPPSEPPEPPWQKTSEEIEQADAQLRHAPLAAARMASLVSLAALVARLGPIAADLEHLLAGLDQGKLKSLLDAIRGLLALPAPSASVDWTKAATAAALKLLRVWSASRPGDPDHELLDRIDHLLSTGGPALDAVSGLVGELFKHQPQAAEISHQHLGDVLQAGHSEAFRAAAINPATIFSIVQAIFQLLQLFRGLKKPAPSPAPLPAPKPAGA